MINIDNHVTLASDDSFLRECWAWYGLGCLVIFMRFGVRLRTVGFRGLEGDDLMAFFSLIMYTGDAVLVHIVYETGSNVDVAPNMVNLLTDNEVARIRYGSQCQLAAWYTYTALIWCMKFMLLFFYRRLMMGTAEGRFIKPLFWICGFTYTAVFLTITFGCHPIAGNWQVRPLPSRACSFKPQNFYVGAILNVVTDAMILAIPVPMLWRLQVRLSKKIAIGALICSGLFVITAAIVRAVLTLGATPSGLNINRWGVRETIVGIITVNVPILRPMLNKRFWTGSGPGSTDNTMGWSSSNKGRYGQGTFELRSGVNSTRSGKADAGIEVASTGSEENIIRKNDNDLAFGDVMVETTYHVQSHHRDEENGTARGRNASSNGFHTDVTAMNAMNNAH